jgi:RNA polymerase sigma-70 factor (ECF subfamily)
LELSPETLRHAIAGDRAARQELLKRCHDFIRRTLYRIAGPTQDLDDLTQTVMEKMLVGLDGLRPDSSLPAWVSSICVNAARDHWRRRKTRSIMGGEPEGGMDRLAGETINVHDRSEARDSLRICQSALDQLSLEQRTAFILKVIEGFSVEEVAEIMDSAQSTTRLRLYFGRKAFYKALEKGGAVPSEIEADVETGPSRRKA